MELIYPFIITFTLIFFSELGDKTQLLVITFSSKNKTKNILIGVAIGTIISHGMAILFGSKIAYLSNETFQIYLKIFTYTTFILLGIIGFIPKQTKNNNKANKPNILQKFTSLKINCIIVIAICILIGELGDKTFLASLSLGVEYPNAKIPLIMGAVCGMVASNFIAIFCGKLLKNHIKENIIETTSNLTFIIFGILGLLSIK